MLKPSHRLFLSLPLACLLLAGCAGPGLVDGEQVTVCKDPRPEICTLDYNPVCGLLDSGQRREFSNGCSACADPAVTGYVPGPCQQ
jgi:hypothetical protein